MATCDNCGYSIQDSAAFCPKCGTAVAIASASAQTEEPSRKDVAERATTNVFGYVGVALALVAVVLTVIQPWVTTRVGTEFASSLVALLGGEGFALEPSYSIWQFVDLGKVVGAYASSLGVENANSVPLVFTLMSVAWAAGVILVAMGAYRYALTSEHPMNRAVEGCLLLAILLWYTLGVLDSYSVVMSRPETLTWALYAAAAAVVAFGVSYVASQIEDSE